MSHAATNWAIVACRGHTPSLSGNAKMVLWHLADCHNPQNGIFCKQESLAEWCEISRATVNRCLDELIAAGLVRRQPRVDKSTGRQASTQYSLRFEWVPDPLYVGDRVAKRDTVLTGPAPVEKPVDTGSKTEPVRVSKTGGSVSHSYETQTCKEPITPLTPQQSSDLLTQLIGLWNSDRVNAQAVERAHTTLSEEERQQAVEMVDSYRRGIYALKRELPPLARYLRRRLWREFVDAPPIADGLFRISDDRPEWQPWLDHIKRVHGPTAWIGTKRQGYTLVPTRLPPATIPEPKDDDDA